MLSWNPSRCQGIHLVSIYSKDFDGIFFNKWQEMKYGEKNINRRIYGIGSWFNLCLRAVEETIAKQIKSMILVLSFLSIDLSLC